MSRSGNPLTTRACACRHGHDSHRRPVARHRVRDAAAAEIANLHRCDRADARPRRGCQHRHFQRRQRVHPAAAAREECRPPGCDRDRGPGSSHAARGVVPRSPGLPRRHVRRVRTDCRLQCWLSGPCARRSSPRAGARHVGDRQLLSAARCPSPPRTAHPGGGGCTRPRRRCGRARVFDVAAPIWTRPVNRGEDRQGERSDRHDCRRGAS